MEDLKTKENNINEEQLALLIQPATNNKINYITIILK